MDVMELQPRKRIQSSRGRLCSVRPKKVRVARPQAVSGHAGRAAAMPRHTGSQGRDAGLAQAKACMAAPGQSSQRGRLQARKRNQCSSHSQFSLNWLHSRALGGGRQLSPARPGRRWRPTLRTGEHGGTWRIAKRDARGIRPCLSLHRTEHLQRTREDGWGGLGARRVGARGKFYQNDWAAPVTIKSPVLLLLSMRTALLWAKVCLKQINVLKDELRIHMLRRTLQWRARRPCEVFLTRA